MTRERALELAHEVGSMVRRMPMREQDDFIADAILAAVAEERATCAQECQQYVIDRGMSDHALATARVLAMHLVRARGERKAVA